MLVDGILKGLKKRGYRDDSTQNIIPLVHQKCRIGPVQMGLSNVQKKKKFICPLHLVGNMFSDKIDDNQSSTLVMFTPAGDSASPVTKQSIWCSIGILSRWQKTIYTKQKYYAKLFHNLIDQMHYNQLYQEFIIYVYRRGIYYELLVASTNRTALVLSSLKMVLIACRHVLQLPNLLHDQQRSVMLKLPTRYYYQDTILSSGYILSANWSDTRLFIQRYQMACHKGHRFSGINCFGSQTSS